MLPLYQVQGDNSRRFWIVPESVKWMRGVCDRGRGGILARDRGKAWWSGVTMSINDAKGNLFVLPYVLTLPGGAAVKRKSIVSHGRDGIALIAVLVTVLAGTAQGQGIALDGAGPVNRSMGGAATAAPIDSIGALLWNPGSIGGLPTSELAFGFEALLPTEEVSSSIAQGALGGGFPAATLAGSTQGEPGITPIPSMAWVHKVQDSRWTCGLGMFGIAGFSANYPASLTNPILFPQNNQPGGFGGLGHVAANAQYFQIVPTCCYALTDKLSVGFGPTVTLGRVTATPLSFVAPDDADGSLVARYPVSATTRYSWGGGFQLGAYYVTDAAWQFGFSFKSPQWFEPYRLQCGRRSRWTSSRGWPFRLPDDSLSRNRVYGFREVVAGV